MLPSMFNNTALQSLEKTVEFSERRHSVLAGNIANMDTPGYRTRDLSVDDFQKTIRNLSDTRKRIAEESTVGRLSVLETPEMPVEPIESDEQAVQLVHDSMRQVVYQDGSDDSIEMQVSEMAKNQTMHNMAISLMRSQFQTLKMAISESVNV